MLQNNKASIKELDALMDQRKFQEVYDGKGNTMIWSWI